MTTRPLKILLYPEHPPSYKKMLSIAHSLRERGVTCVFLAAEPFVLQKTSALQDCGFEVVSVNKHEGLNVNGGSAFQSLGKIPNALSTESILVKAKHRLRPFIPKILLRLKKSFYFYVKRRELRKDIKAKYNVIGSILDNVDPDKVLLAGDNAIRHEAVLIKHCRERGIETLIPPISVSGTPKDKATFRYKRGEHFDTSDDAAFEKKWPDQVQIGRFGNKVSFYPKWMVKTLCELGVLCPKPWVWGGGYSDYVMIRGDSEEQMLISHGVPPRKIIMTGDSEYDDIYSGKVNREEIRKKVCDEYLLDRNSPLLIISLPPLYEHKILDWEKHWGFVNDTLSQINRVSGNVLISLHPKMNVDHYSHLTQEYRVKLSVKPLREFVCCGDILMVSQGSGTVLWGILASVPTLVMDWFGLDYEDHTEYLEKAGVVVLKYFDSLLPAVEKLLKDDKYRAQQIRAQNRVIPDITIFDGKAMDRVVECITTGEH